MIDAFCAVIDVLPPHCGLDLDLDPDRGLVRFRALRPAGPSQEGLAPLAASEPCRARLAESSEWSGWFTVVEGEKIHLTWAAFSWPEPEPAA